MKIALEIGRRRREVVLPEGVPLSHEIAGAGDRAAAFLVDLLIVLASTFFIGLLAVMGGGASDLGFALALLALFLVRNLYWIWFEARWHGQSPGKRSMGLRVVSRDGGPLRPEAIVARNLTRELEVFMPGIMLVFPEAVPGDHGGGFVLLAIAWMLLLGTLPLFNRDRLRAGDLVAGTLVVKRPEVRLDADPSSRTATAADGLRFTRAQLGHYGVYELQVLEEVLRDRRHDTEALRRVGGNIRKRIGWEEPVPDEAVFLASFYKAQRAHLERDLLLGRARERKDAADGTPDGDA